MLGSLELALGAVLLYRRRRARSQHRNALDTPHPDTAVMAMGTGAPAAKRSLGRLAWVTCAAAELCVVACLVLAVGRITWSGAVEGYLATNLVMATTFAAVGGLVAGNRPQNRIGWLFLCYGSCFGLATLFGTIAITRGETLSVDSLRVLTALFMGLWPLGIGIVLPLVVQLFPTGRPVSSRWRWLVAATVVTGLGFDAQVVLDAGEWTSIAGGRTVPPLLDPATFHALDALWSVLTVSLTAVLMLSVTALAVRFHRSNGVERLQLGWLLWAAAIVAILNLPRWLTTDGPILLLFTLPLIPVAAAVAILRHDLYDIRLIINRTLVYGSLSGLLAAGYAAVVLLLSELSTRIGVLAEGATGGRPSWVIAVATLAAAAAVRPLRRSVQGTVDRRFYRRRYDAARILDAFSARMLHDGDRDTLTSDLSTTVRQALQPASVSLWLRPPPPRRPS